MMILWNKPSFYTFGHILAGVITILGSMISLVVPLVLFSGFMIYELNEDWHLSDQAYKDILEYCIGMYACVGVIVCLLML